MGSTAYRLVILAKHFQESRTSLPSITISVAKQIVRLNKTLMKHCHGCLLSVGLILIMAFELLVIWGSLKRPVTRTLAMWTVGTYIFQEFPEL